MSGCVREGGVWAGEPSREGRLETVHVHAPLWKTEEALLWFSHAHLARCPVSYLPTPLAVSTTRAAWWVCALLSSLQREREEGGWARLRELEPPTSDASLTTTTAAAAAPPPSLPTPLSTTTLPTPPTASTSTSTTRTTTTTTRTTSTAAAPLPPSPTATTTLLLLLLLLLLLPLILPLLPLQLSLLPPPPPLLVCYYLTRYVYLCIYRSIYIYVSCSASSEARVRRQSTRAATSAVERSIISGLWARVSESCCWFSFASAVRSA